MFQNKPSVDELTLLITGSPSTLATSFFKRIFVCCLRMAFASLSLEKRPSRRPTVSDLMLTRRCFKTRSMQLVAMTLGFGSRVKGDTGLVGTLREVFP